MHELVHALMAINGLGGTAYPWPGSRAYPNDNEFCASTIKNMMLLEHGTRLVDGYSRNGPTIKSVHPLGRSRGSLGVQADNSLTNTAAFVARYRSPLLFYGVRCGLSTGRLPTTLGPLSTSFVCCETSSVRRSVPF
jgi:hypothetical protein